MSVRLNWTVECPHGVSAAALERAAELALAHGDRAGEDFEIVLVSDDELAEMHGRFLNDPSPTDVMAFDLGEDDEGPAGEVYVSVGCARRVSRIRAVSLERELALYVVHGCLHLCGHDDHEEEDRRRMRRAETELLEQLGYPDDSAPHELGSESV